MGHPEPGVAVVGDPEPAVPRQLTEGGVPVGDDGDPPRDQPPGLRLGQYIQGIRHEGAATMGAKQLAPSESAALAGSEEECIQVHAQI